jgi:hypothetical protein
MVMAIPSFLPSAVEGWHGRPRSERRAVQVVGSNPGQSPNLRDGTCRCQCAVWKSSVDDARRRLMTPSQAESPSAPEAIEDQP